MKVLILMLPNAGSFLLKNLSLFKNEKFTTSISIGFLIVQILLDFKV